VLLGWDVVRAAEFDNDFSIDDIDKRRVQNRLASLKDAKLTTTIKAISDALADKPLKCHRRGRS